MIFLCYAQEDRETVQTIYRELRRAGLYPWMDKPPAPWTLDGVGPGEDWDVVIREQLSRADAVLTFLSKASVAKRGYVQREYRLALDLAAEQPAGSVFVIPILLEECEPPNLRVGVISLLQFQWFKYYDSGLQPLLQYLAEILDRADEAATGAPGVPRRRRRTASAEPYRISLQRTLVDLFELQKLPPEKAMEMVDRLARMIFQAVLVRVLPSLSEEDLTEYERIVDEEDGGDAMLVFFGEVVPDFNEIVFEEAELLRAELAGEFDAAGL